MDGSRELPSWVDLPDLVTELILEHLPLPDYIRFAAVCRRWGSIQKDHRLRHSPHPPPMGAHPLPWLIPLFCYRDTGLDCYSPLEKRLRRLRLPTSPTFPESTLCMTPSSGWLLMLERHEDDDLEPFDPRPPSRRPFLFNPLTGAVISLPMPSIDLGGNYFGALSSSPHDPDCTILFARGRSVFMCRSNDPGDGWTMGLEIEEWIDSAVYHCGKFYCISTEGTLYVIDRVLSTPTLLRLTMDVSALDRRARSRCRLVESGGELLLVMELYNWQHRVEGFQVFKADISGEKWVKKMDMLADHVLFLDANSSFSLLASDMGWKKNCIYYHGPWDSDVFDLDARNWIDKETFRHDRFSDKFCLWCWFLPTLG